MENEAAGTRRPFFLEEAWAGFRPMEKVFGLGR